MEPKNNKRDHELENLGDFGKVKFDPDAVADTAEEQAELDTERYREAEPKRR